MGRHPEPELQSKEAISRLQRDAEILLSDKARIREEIVLLSAEKKLLEEQVTELLKKKKYLQRSVNNLEQGITTGRKMGGSKLMRDEAHMIRWRKELGPDKPLLVEDDNYLFIKMISWVAS